VVNAFGQVEGRREVAQLIGRQRYLADRVSLGIPLFDRDLGVECQQRDILAQRCVTFVDKGDRGCLEFVFYCKHSAILPHRDKRASVAVWRKIAQALTAV